MNGDGAGGFTSRSERPNRRALVLRTELANVGVEPVPLRPRAQDNGRASSYCLRHWQLLAYANVARPGGDLTITAVRAHSDPLSFVVNETQSSCARVDRWQRFLEHDLAHLSDVPRRRQRRGESLELIGSDAVGIRNFSRRLLGCDSSSGIERAPLGSAALRQISCDFGEARESSVGLPKRGNENVRPESASVLANTPALFFVRAFFFRNFELVLRVPDSVCLRRIKDREVLADDFIGRVAL